MSRLNIFRLFVCLARYATVVMAVDAVADDSMTPTDDGLSAHVDYRVLHDSDMYRSPGPDASDYIADQPTILTTVGGGVALKETESLQKLTASFDWDQLNYRGYLPHEETWNAKVDWNWHMQDWMSGDAQVNAFRNLLSFESSGPGIIDFDDGQVATFNAFLPIAHDYQLFIEPTVDRERHSEASYLDSNLDSISGGIGWTSSDRVLLQLFIAHNKLNYVLADSIGLGSQADYVEDQLGMTASWANGDALKIDGKASLVSWHYIGGTQQFHDFTGEFSATYKPNSIEQIYLDLSRAYNQVDDDQYRQQHDIALLEWAHTVAARTQVKLSGSMGWTKDIVPAGTPTYAERLRVGRLELDWNPLDAIHVRLFLEQRSRYSDDVDLTFDSHIIGTYLRYDF